MNFNAKDLSMVEVANTALMLCPHEQLKYALIATAEKVISAFAMQESALHTVPESARAKLLCELIAITILDAINEAGTRGIRRDAQPAPNAEAIAAAEKLAAKIIAQAARHNDAPKV